jgi:hypothetical protein
VLLLITGSSDGTADLLVSRLGEQVFRLNFDLWADYRIEISPGGWRVEGPTGRAIDSRSVSRCFWWKAFSYELQDTEPFVVEEIKYIFRELYNWCTAKGIVLGNPPDFHNRHGKLNLLAVAKKHFPIPDTLLSIGLAGSERFKGKETVAKSLASGLTTTGHALFTTQVNPASLDPAWPWYLQTKIDSDADITVLICGGRVFSFARPRKHLKGLDWRAEQSMDPTIEEWARFDLDPKSDEAVRGFCSDIDVEWGRLDLMRTDAGYVFLEFNANGQWVFLDFQNRHGLLDAVTGWLEQPPASEG